MSGVRLCRSARVASLRDLRPGGHIGLGRWRCDIMRRHPLLPLDSGPRGMLEAPALYCHGRTASSASAGKEGSLRAPAGYYAPRIAVFAATTVGSVALYELLSSRLLAPALDTGDVTAGEGLDWDDKWDDALVVGEHAKDAGLASSAAALLATAMEQRKAANASVTRRHVILVRHARPTQQSSGGGTSALSAEGQRQAKLTGERLQQALKNIEVRFVYHSDAPESKATAAVLQSSISSRKQPGSCRMVESALLAEGIPVVPSPAPAGLVDATSEAGLAADVVRAEAAFRAHVWRPKGDDAQSAAAEIVVGHGNSLRYLACRALQLPPTAWSRLKASHCAVTWLEIDSQGHVSLHEFGGVGHLPHDLQTYH